MNLDEEICGIKKEELMENLDEDSYNPDDFYKKCKDEITEDSIYDIVDEKPFELGITGEDNSDHYEVIAGFGIEVNLRDVDTYVRFVLRDGRSGYKVPRICEVEAIDDFDLDQEQQ